MILVVASIADALAPNLVSQFHGEAALLTSLDLSIEGTSLSFHSFDDGTLVAQGKEFPVRSISGVVSLTGSFYPQELVQISASDREYVCREMNAFMIWLLSQLRCPMLNRPSVNCFSGPMRKMEAWAALARQADIPIAPLRRDNLGRTNPLLDKETKWEHVTIIGREFVGTENEELRDYATRLANCADLDLLSVVFSKDGSRGFEFRNASPFPDLSSENTLKAIPHFFKATAL